MLNRREFSKLGCLSLLYGFTSVRHVKPKNKKISSFKVVIEYELTPSLGIGQIACADPFSSDVDVCTHFIKLEFDDNSVEKYTTTFPAKWEKSNFNKEKFDDCVALNDCSKCYIKRNEDSVILTICYMNNYFSKKISHIKPYYGDKV